VRHGRDPAMSTVFVSHSSKDREIALRICGALEEKGIRCWIASRDIGPGENFGAAIVRAIRAAKVMLLVFSHNANASDEIKKELVLAGQNRLTVIPARVEDVVPEDAFAYEFSTRQWIDLFTDWDREINRLGVWILNSLAVADLSPETAIGAAPVERAVAALPDSPESASRADLRPGTFPLSPRGRRAEHAAEDLGGYTRQAHELYEGTFLLYRRSFSKAGSIFRSVMEIAWDESEPGLVFTDYYQSGRDHPEDVKAHRGRIHISPYTGLVHLVTIDHGAVRTMTLTRMRTNDTIMRGLVLTQSDEVAFFQPTVSSVVISKARDYDWAKLVEDITLLTPEAPDHDFAQAQLALAESRIIRLRFGAPM
jgi:hypothetical protein